MIRRLINWHRRRHLAKVIKMLDTLREPTVRDGVLFHKSLPRLYRSRDMGTLLGASNMGSIMLAINDIDYLAGEIGAFPITKEWLIPHIQAYINMRS